MRVYSRKNDMKFPPLFIRKNIQEKQGKRNVAKIKMISWMGSVLAETIRILGMQLVLAPAAYVLPRKWALIIARAVSLPLAVLPNPGINTYWQMRQAFGKNRTESFLLGWGWLTRPFRDFVILKRILHGRENPLHWKIVERNTDGIKSLRESGESYIIASAHFPKMSSLSQHAPKVTCGHPVQVGDALKKRIRSMKDLRIRIQYGALMDVISSSCWGRDVELVYSRSDLRAARILYHRLGERGNVVCMPVDASWNNKASMTFERPFAGHRKMVFSRGAAHLARLSKCAIISCVSKLEDDETVVLEWGRPIRINGNGAAEDVQVMNELMDALEIGIGERPTQYIFDIGWGRRWNSITKRWEDMGP
jgi:hypothetical protein